MGIAQCVRRLFAALLGRTDRRETPDMPEREGAAGGQDLPDAVVVTDTLDLHGFFPEQIAEVIDAFLEQAVELRLGEVRIIHGKGRSVLKREVWKVLKNDARVAAFREAPPGRGGWGATIAFIVRA